MIADMDEFVLKCTDNNSKLFIDEAVKSYIKYIFNMHTTIQIDNQNYIIRKLSHNESKLFFNQNFIF